MTTIAFDGRTIAADSQYTVGDKKYFKDDKIKCITVRDYIKPEDNEAYLCIAGCFSLFSLVINFAQYGQLDTNNDYEILKNSNDVDAFYVTQGGDLFYLTKNEFNMPCWHVMDKPIAIGSGGDIALGVMLNGGNAEMAVKTASQVDLYTGGKIQKINIKGK